MAWRRPGDKPLSEPMIVRFPPHICVTRPQWVLNRSLLIKVMILSPLTHWRRVTHICVSKLTIIGSDNGFSPGRRQAIIWTNAWIWLIRTLGTNFSEILNEIHTSSFRKMHVKMSPAKWRLFCLGLNEITNVQMEGKPCFTINSGVDENSL